ncbi:MAG TPA: hypothetical protein VHY36_13385 [Steroidobacteraceae bacterium]|jgi:hypothetical protein|nr:hypothetical protein [Steroidobacteraceae bacterium]
MALAKCPDCGCDLSTEAPACPKCGRPNAPPKKKKKTSPVSGGCGLILLIVFIIVAAGAIFSSKDPTPAASSDSSADKPVNLKDASALDDKYWIEADGNCSAGADDYLRSIAKWDFKWDKEGFGDIKFDHFLKAVSTPGVLTVVSHKAALQNGFGAYQHIDLLCEYDTQADKVLGYSFMQQ